MHPFGIWPTPSTQQDELARQDRLVRHQSIQVSATGHGATGVVPTVPMEPVVAGLLRPLVKNRHPLPGQCEYF